MKLIDLCQPLFRYVCLLNRSARHGGDADLNQVQTEVKVLLSEMSAASRTDPALAAKYQKIEPVLMFFVDEMVRKSRLNFAADWHGMAQAAGISDGDERFFDMMDAALREPGGAAREQLQVYYACIGLGFTGWYAGQAEHLRKRMLELSARLRGTGDADQGARIVPEAYEHVDTSNLIESPGASIAGILIGLFGIVAVLLVVNVYLYQVSYRRLDGAINDIAQGNQRATTNAPTNGNLSGGVGN